MSTQPSLLSERIGITVPSLRAGIGVVTRAAHWTFAIDIGGAGTRTTTTHDLDVR